MSERSDPDRSGPAEVAAPGPPPAADPAQEAVFGRPPGVEGSFEPMPAHGPANGFVVRTPPPTPELTAAFERPPGNEDVLLQRPPGATRTDQPATEQVLWTDDDGQDPWRDPGAGVLLGPPAVDPATSEPSGDRPAGPLLSLPEVLFGRRVKPTALVFLLVAAMFVGAAGGVVGWALGRAGTALTDAGATIAGVDQGKERAPDSVAGIAARVAPAVVSLEVQAGNGGDVGSGVVIDANGYVLTNNHVVALAAGDGGRITAVFSGGRRVAAAIVGRDPVTDLAVLKVNADNLTVATAGTATELRPGDTVIAIGSPLGLAGTVTAGIVSALHRAVTAQSEDGGQQVVYDAIQTDAAINPGNSGGALVDSTGALVGINSAIQTYGGAEGGGGGNIGLGFAIPIDQARKVAQSLIRTGQAKHAALGVNTRSVSATTSEGAQVVNVVVDGPAAVAGVVEGDVITEFDGRRIGSSAELQAAVLDHDPGQTVTMRFDRQGQLHAVSVTLRSD